MKRQPNFFFIGGMRCGSTSLHLLLGQHPQIFMSPVKEPMFYRAEAMRRTLQSESVGIPSDLEKKLSDYVAIGKHRETESYQALFAEAQDELFLGESSHYLYSRGAAKTIFEDCPDARILISLRNPIKRTCSEYQLYAREQNKKNKGLSFDDFVRSACHFDEKTGEFLELKPTFLRKSLYSKHLESWFEVFDQNQIKIIFFENLASDPIAVCQSIFSWLGVDSDFCPHIIRAQQGGVPQNRLIFDFMRKFCSKTGLKSVLPPFLRERLKQGWNTLNLKKEEISPETFRLLQEIYKEEILALKEKFCLDLSLWK